MPVKKDSPDGQAMGILSDSVIVADHLATVLPREIDKVNWPLHLYARG